MRRQSQSSLDHGIYLNSFVVRTVVFGSSAARLAALPHHLVLVYTNTK
jgi:hypothetical protein